MNPQVQAANRVLRAAARSWIWMGVVCLAILSALIAFMVADRTLWGIGLAGRVFLCVLVVGTVWGAWARHREASSLRIAPEGFQLREGGAWILVPWDTVREIDIMHRGFRVHATGRRPFSVSLWSVGDTKALVDLISDKRPAATRLRL